MIIVTVATHDSGYFEVLKESCVRYGHRLQVLGYGEPWQGFGRRLQLIREFLETLHAEEIVVFMDAYDTFVVADESTILARFHALQSPIVISTQQFDSLLVKYSYHKTFGAPCRGQKICAGMYMGYAQALIGLFAESCSEFDCDNVQLDDQRMLMSMCKLPGGYFE